MHLGTARNGERMLRTAIDTARATIAPTISVLNGTNIRLFEVARADDQWLVSHVANQKLGISELNAAIDIANKLGREVEAQAVYLALVSFFGAVDGHVSTFQESIHNLRRELKVTQRCNAHCELHQ